ncbi:hypothetical protein OnM2_035106 [Erysiphe neolycopersici]|uniref:Uncharacterized protein n=1 Tax=Erysiphe neolycopersici TaxID=212602 RepID=A0A420HXL9_9PEZI|nr:hypothetical protein OnM2_035106 [Erysiphe neolycopersici]
MSFEQFSSNSLYSESCVVGLDNQHMESTRGNCSKENSEYPSQNNDFSFDNETVEDCRGLPSVKVCQKVHRRGQRALKHLREIIGRSGKGPINYTKLAEEIKVNVSLLDLFQMSPELSREFRNISTRIVPKRAAKIAGAKAAGVHRVVVDQEIPGDNSKGLQHILSYVNMEERAFCVPALIRTKKGRISVDVRLPSTVNQADTGSDMVVISYGLVKHLDLPMKLLSENGFSGLTMNVANGTSSPLKFFSSFRINVMGISRNVEAFNEKELNLLLGLPWLHDANAKIYMRDSIIEIGDPDRSENVLKVKGPEFTQSSQNKLILHLKTPKSKDFRMNCSDSSSEDSDESESESDISLNDELFENPTYHQEPNKKKVAFSKFSSKK